MTNNVNESVESRRVKLGNKMFFFDVKQAKNGNKYLRITESRLVTAGQWSKNSITLFKEQAGEFLRVLGEMGQLMN